MAQREVKVTIDKKALGRIPEIFTMPLVAWVWLLHFGIIDEVKRRLRLRRKSGCNGWELFGMLVLLWLAKVGGQRGLEKNAKGCSEALATVIGMRRWYGQSSMSRTLESVTQQQSREMGDYLLRTAFPVSALERDRSTFHRDTFGEYWRVVDVDGRAHPLRQRGLPEGDDLPEAIRQAEELAKPGYRGRKRGEVQFHEMSLQDAGTGRALGVRVEPGNGDHPTEMNWAAETTALWADQLGIPRDHMVLRFDGKSSGTPSLMACVTAGIRFLTRWTEYPRLESPEAIERMRKEPWRDVPDSGSGPKRGAMELGYLVLYGSEPNKSREGRIVATRYRLGTGEKHGVGKLIDGYVYELFITSLPMDAWPAAEIVELYFGRAAEENRFGRQDAELGNTHPLSYCLAGQELARVVGLFTWNVRLFWGAELAQWESKELPPQLPREPDASTAPESTILQATNQESDLSSTSPEASLQQPSCPEELHPARAAAGTEESAATKASTDISTAESAAAAGTASEIAHAVEADPAGPSEDESIAAGLRNRAVDRLVQVALLTTLVWSSHLQTMPGWTWDEQQRTLFCPAKEPMIFHAFRSQTATTQRAIFRIRREKTCRLCEHRAACTRSTSSKFRKEVSFTLPGQVAAKPRKRVHQQTTTTPKTPVPATLPTRRACPSEPSRPAGPYAPIAPALIPSVLRHKPAEILGSCAVAVEVPKWQKRKPDVAWLSGSKAERQHQRKTWTKRDERNLLPNSQALKVHLEVPSCMTRAERHVLVKTMLSAGNGKGNG